MTFPFAVGRGAKDRVPVGRADLNRIVQFVKIPFPVGQPDPLALGHAPRRRRRGWEGLEPAETLLFVNRFGIAATIGARRRWRPCPTVGVEQPQRDPVGPEGQPAVPP
jgi:hypothetical protein